MTVIFRTQNGLEKDPHCTNAMRFFFKKPSTLLQIDKEINQQTELYNYAVVIANRLINSLKPRDRKRMVEEYAFYLGVEWPSSDPFWVLNDILELSESQKLYSTQKWEEIIKPLKTHYNPGLLVDLINQLNDELFIIASCFDPSLLKLNPDPKYKDVDTAITPIRMLCYYNHNEDFFSITYGIKINSSYIESISFETESITNFLKKEDKSRKIDFYLVELKDTHLPPNAVYKEHYQLAPLIDATFKKKTPSKK